MNGYKVRILAKVYCFFVLPRGFTGGKKETNQPNHESSMNTLYYQNNIRAETSEFFARRFSSDMLYSFFGMP